MQQLDNELIRNEFESLRLASLKRCANQNEYETVVRAFEFANEAHKGVKRRSGEPYIIHPISVAKIVVEEIGLGYKSIASALLHDVVEDTDYTVEDLERLFSPKIASLVDGLTKIKSAMDNRDIVQTAENQVSLQAENFKRILLTLNDDVRVVLIKLADRLHNLRTIESLPERKKDKILSETMYLFIPLAHRLGLYSIKSEMENIWLRYREPDAYSNILKRVESIESERVCVIDKFIKPVSKILTNAGYTFKILKRTKSPYSIWRKMQVKNIPFDEIYDLFAIRIIFDPKPNITERKQCWEIYTLISEDYDSKLDRMRDWTKKTKSNGYEALHSTFMSEGNWFETQIRSVRMNDIAEKGVAAHWNYKGVSKGDNDIDKWLNMVSEVLNNPDVNAVEFLDKFHEGLLAADIYVFTPKGESKALNKGATALDFAYSIHTKIGNKAIAAKVNFKLVPISTVLKNGDQVEIITAESQKPKREWLNFVTTQKAKNLIYSALKSETKDHIKEGQIILENQLAKYGVKPQLRVFKKLIDAYKVNNKEELYSKISTGIIDLSNLESVLKRNTASKFVKYWNLQFFQDSGDSKKEDEKEKEKEDKKENSKRKPKINKKEDYILEENPLDKTLSYNVAECCLPIPGDTIIGFVDDNNNVTVHKKTCTNAISLAATNGANIVNAKWTKHTILSSLAKLSIRGIDRLGIVNDLTKYITLVLNVNIRKIHVETHDGVFEGYIELYVHNAQDLEDMIKNIKKIKSIDTVVRVDVNETTA